MKYKTLYILSLFLLLMLIFSFGRLLYFPTQIKNDIISMDKVPSASDWTDNGNLVIGAANRQWLPQICSDGNGGSIIIWMDDRYEAYEYDIFAQRIDNNGNIQWASGGVAICTAYSDQDNPQICSDGAGGAIITWKDYRGSGSDIYAQRINNNGTTLWTTNGRAISTAASYQWDPEICSDGLGGAIIVWQDQRTDSEGDIYAQRINSNGDSLWNSNGIPICTASSYQGLPKIYNLGTGHIIITWEDRRGGSYFEVYAQKVSLDGNIQWNSNGVNVYYSGLFFGNNRFPYVCKDGSGGAIITWCHTEWRESIPNVYAQRISNNGNKLWTDDGIVIIYGNANMDYEEYEPRVCYDGQGGGVITWEDKKLSSSWDLFAQRVDSNGNLKWSNDGIIISNASGDQIQHRTIQDGLNGFFFVWNGVSNIYAQQVDIEGNLKMPFNGVSICSASGIQSHPCINSVAPGIAIIAWDDSRNGSYDIYAQILLDKDQPVLNILTPDNYTVYGIQSPTVDLEIIGRSIDSKWYTLDFGSNNYTFQDNTVIINESAWEACENGTVIIQFFVNNTSGNIAQKQIAIYKDIISPEISIVVPLPYQTFGNSTPYYEVVIDDGNLDQMWYSLNNGLNYTFYNKFGLIDEYVWSLCGNGTVNLRFYANDTLGNEAWEEIIIYKDTHFPELSIILPHSGSLYGNDSPEFELEIIDPSLNKTWYELNGNSGKFFFTGFTGKIDQDVWDLEGNGTVIISFSANNSVGNSIVKQILVRKDIEKPLITIVNPTPYQTFGSSAPFYELSIIERNLNSTWYSLNNGANHSFFGLSGMIEQSLWDTVDNGTVLITFYANDSLGNFAYKEVLIQKDIDPPIWESLPENQIIELGESLFYDLNASDSSGTVNWWINDTLNFIIDQDGILFNIIPLEVNSYWLEIRISDAFNNNCSAILNIFVQDTIIPVWIEEPSNHSIKYGENFIYDLNATDTSGVINWWINNTLNFNINQEGVIRNSTRLLVGIYYLEIKAYNPSDNYCSVVITIIVEEQIPSQQPPSGIPGYNLYLLIAFFGIISTTLIKRKVKS